MGKSLLYLCSIFSVFHALGQTSIPIGQWRNHLPMRQLVNVENDGKKIIAASQYGLFFYDPTAKEFQLKTTSDGLSEVRVSFISKDPSSAKVLIAYQNGNLDILEDDKVYNMPDILRTIFQGTKNVYHGLWSGTDLYLSTSLGIVTVNTSRYEIRESIRIGDNGSNIEVYQLVLFGGVLYAATESGIKKITFPNPALADYRAWTSENIPFTSGRIKRLLQWNDKLIAQKSDTLFVKENGIWKILYAAPSSISFVSVRNGKLLVGLMRSGNGSLMIYDNLNSSPNTLSTPSMMKPVDAIFVSDKLWVADGENGLLSIANSADEAIVPASPRDIAAGRAVFANRSMVATQGALDISGIPLSRPAGVFAFDENGWKNLYNGNLALLDTVKDLHVAAIDPLTESIWAGSFGGGLLEIPKGANPRLYKYGSLLSASQPDPASFRVTGLAFDPQRNLWIANHGSANPLVVRKPDGTWKRFSTPFQINGNTLRDITIDEGGRKWISGGPGNGLICFDDGGTPDIPNDDRWRWFRQGRGNGNLPSSTVLSLSIDRNGFLWVGTDRGVALIQCGEDIFNAAKCDAILPVVQQDNVTGLLLANEQVNDIKVDGADRKWFATGNGVWLLSADAQKIIFRFTKTTGKLLSNMVHSISIQQETGEVFFLTADGICSFRSTATEPLSEPKKLFVFPNPVPSGYNGSIAIRGLASNAWVRIVELDGKLVFQTRSLGGQAIWNGKNYNGEKASSGVYLIYTSDENNRQQLAGKIFFIR
jgi:ligand-binding sensor domain-containing protein